MIFVPKITPCIYVEIIPENCWVSWAAENFTDDLSGVDDARAHAALHARAVAEAARASHG